MKRKDTFPFTAIIGQEDMKKALVLNVVNPRLGGVLIQGEKGTAKSTGTRDRPITTRIPWGSPSAPAWASSTTSA